MYNRQINRVTLSLRLQLLYNSQINQITPLNCLNHWTPRLLHSHSPKKLRNFVKFSCIWNATGTLRQDCHHPLELDLWKYFFTSFNIFLDNYSWTVKHLCSLASTTFLHKPLVSDRKRHLADLNNILWYIFLSKGHGSEQHFVIHIFSGRPV